MKRDERRVSNLPWRKIMGDSYREELKRHQKYARSYARFLGSPRAQAQAQRAAAIKEQKATKTRRQVKLW